MVPVGSTGGAQQGEGRRRTPPGRRPPDESMFLLSRIADSALDPDYRRVAERRQEAGAGGKSSAAGKPPDEVSGARSHGLRRPRWAGSVALGVGLLAIGLMISVAAERVQANASVISAERETLITRIDDANAEVEDLFDQVASLEADIRALETAQLE